MRALRLLTGLILAIAFAGCSAPQDTVMPSVLGSQLDVAKSDIKRAGFSGKVEVLGGGILGIIDESNWQVCEQLPTAGQVVRDAPRTEGRAGAPGGRCPAVQRFAGGDPFCGGHPFGDVLPAGGGA